MSMNLRSLCDNYTHTHTHTHTHIYIYIYIYIYISPISKTIQVRQARHAGHCWRRASELICEVLLWTPSHGWVRVEPPGRTYLQRLCTDSGFGMEDLPRVMDDWDGWHERVRGIQAAARHDDDEIEEVFFLSALEIHKIADRISLSFPIGVYLHEEINDSMCVYIWVHWSSIKLIYRTLCENNAKTTFSIRSRNRKSKYLNLGE